MATAERMLYLARYDVNHNLLQIRRLSFTYCLFHPIRCHDTVAMATCRTAAAIGQIATFIHKNAILFSGRF